MKCLDQLYDEHGQGEDGQLRGSCPDSRILLIELVWVFIELSSISPCLHSL